MRKLPALLITGGLLAVSLTACTPSGSADCESSVVSGDSSSIVSVTGERNAKPTVDFPTPLKGKTTERTVVIDGDGPDLVDGQQISVDWSVFNGTTGDLLLETAYDGEKELSMVLADDQQLVGVHKGLLCTPVGSRVVLVVPPADALGEEGNAQLGVAPTDSLVFVIDVNSADLPRANGTPQPDVAGFPAVVLDENGVPGITVPSSAPPADFGVAVLKQGDGQTVAEGNQVVVHYTGVVWDSSVREPFDSSWSRGVPTTLRASEGSATVQDGVIKGFADALIGQQVGSQIIAVIPPELGYGEQANGQIPANSTLVFVIDILGIA